MVYPGWCLALACVVLCVAGCATPPPMATEAEVRALERSLPRGGGGAGAAGALPTANPFGTRTTLGPPPNPIAPRAQPVDAIVASPAPPIAEQAVTDLERRNDERFYGSETDCLAARGTFTVRGCLP